MSASSQTGAARTTTTAPGPGTIIDESDDLDPCEAFREHVWKSPAVCNHCFQRIREVVERDPEDYEHTASLRGTLQDETIRAPGGMRAYPSRRSPRDGRLLSGVGEPRTACRDCGRIDGADNDCLTMTRMMEYAANLHQRLQEAGVDADLDAMRDFIRAVKSQSQAQGYDREIFELAAKAGIHAANPDA